jgi:hypothetical protein
MLDDVTRMFKRFSSLVYCVEVSECDTCMLDICTCLLTNFMNLCHASEDSNAKINVTLFSKFS